jgi:hypothetical protein
MSLSEEERREIIRNAGEPKKGHHWAIYFDRTDAKIAEWKTQFRSTDGALVSHRVSRDSYTIVDRETSYIVASVPGRTFAKGLIAELGPTWSTVVKLVMNGDSDAVKRVREIIRKYT